MRGDKNEPVPDDATPYLAAIPPRRDGHEAFHVGGLVPQPEQLARKAIDELLANAGWLVSNADKVLGYDLSVLNRRQQNRGGNPAMSSLQRTATPTVVALLAASVLCVACGTFPLSGGIYPPPGKSSDQQQIDVLACQDQAHLAINSAGRQVGDFLLGATLIGAPIAYELDKSKGREVYAQCMTARGYRVMPVGSASTQPIQQPATQMVPHGSQITLPLPPGWTQQPLRPNMSANPDSILFALNRTIDAGAFLSATNREGIADVATYANSRRAVQASLLGDAQQSSMTVCEVNGNRAFRFTVTGRTENGLMVTYLITVVEGAKEIAVLNTWTSAANFGGQRSVLESLAANLTGL
jgi:hypothetical protein